MMQLRRELWQNGGLTKNFLVLIVAACLIATLGLLENSVAVIIGAMIVAPLVWPIQGFAYGAISADVPLVRRTLAAAAIGAALSIAASAALGAMIVLPVNDAEILARTRPTVLDLGIAIVAGAVGGFARVRSEISEAVAGTAIAVALMPPLCVVGIAIANANWSWALGALLLFVTNFFGIALACMAVYVIAGEVSVRHHVGLMTTALLTAALVVPLSASFAEIAREAHIEAAVRHELRTNTVTFQHAQLVAMRFDWYTRPVTAVLDVNSAGTITSNQVHDLEAFVSRRTGLALQIVADVHRVEIVNSGSPPP